MNESSPTYRDNLFGFSPTYKENVMAISIFVIMSCAVIHVLSILPSEIRPSEEQFVTSVYETNQPNCVVGAYIMFAKETLDKELLIGDIKRKYKVFTNEMVSIGCIKPYWDDMFPKNKLKCVYDVSNTNSYNLVPKFGKPYIWVGNWCTNKNDSCHTCLIYFHTNGVTIKHFVYNQAVRYNYSERADYDFFFNRTIRLYQLQ